MIFRCLLRACHSNLAARSFPHASRGSSRMSCFLAGVTFALNLSREEQVATLGPVA